MDKEEFKVKAKELLQQAVNKRKCGGCTACCKVLEVTELDKPMNVWCKHCTKTKGCNIYEERPPSCQTFECLWLQGLLPEKGRPDKFKLIFSMEQPNFWHEPIVIAYEMLPGASQKRIARQVIETFIKQGKLVWVIKSNDKVLQGRKDLIEIAVNNMRELGKLHKEQKDAKKEDTGGVVLPKREDK